MDKYLNTRELRKQEINECNFSLKFLGFERLRPYFHQVNFPNFTSPSVNLTVESFLILG